MRLPSRNKHCVHRADGLGIVGQLGEQRNDGLLARVRDVEARETHAFGSREQLGQGIDAETELLQVDQLVDAAQAMFRSFTLVHCRRPRCLNARTDEAEQDIGLAAGHHVEITPE